MSRITVPYIDNGERKWAVYSTVVEGVLIYDATPTQIIEYRAEQAEKRARREEARDIIELQNNGYQHRLARAEEIAEKAREELSNYD